ncbi:MAG: LysM peptidoglycan-binding domain-containing protein [Aeromicrobium sp.]
MGWIGEQLVALRGHEFPSAVLALISLVTVAVGAWALLVALLASTPALRGLAVALTPRLLRGLVFAGVAGALTVPAAQAEDRGVDGLRLPDRPLVADIEPVTKQPTVVVQSGDTLWAIARARLGPRADVAATAHEVARWHATNRKVIGDDPDLIHPGQRLDPPSKDRS